MGIMKGFDEDLKQRNKNDPHLWPFRERIFAETDLTRPMMRVEEGHASLSQLPGDISVWTGWLCFDVGICQFEIDQWMKAVEICYIEKKDNPRYSKNLNGKGETFNTYINSNPLTCSNNDSGIELERAESALISILNWNCSNRESRVAPE